MPKEGISMVSNTCLAKSRVKYLIAAAILISAILSTALVNANEVEFLYDFLEGSYQVIGRWPDSQETYSGKVTLSREGNHFKVTRIINGKRIVGTGSIETATADKVKVLRVRFVHGATKYEATYIIGSDLDNYARLTGYVYIKGGKTKQPGLEALFIDHQAAKS